MGHSDNRWSMSFRSSSYLLFTLCRHLDELQLLRHPIAIKLGVTIIIIKINTWLGGGSPRTSLKQHPLPLTS